MPTWIFQANPDQFDLESYLATGELVLWSVRQQHYAQEMRLGDRVYFWRAAGRRRTSASGIVASGHIAGAPSVRLDDARAQTLWKSRVSVELSQLRIPCMIDVPAGQRLLSRDSIMRNADLRTLLILRMRNRTNYKLSTEEAVALERAWHVADADTSHAATALENPGGASPGTYFADRRALADAGIHREMQKGIWGGSEGAHSIVLSGGYEDDHDGGEEIIYTGEGGQDPTTRRHTQDQQLLRGNLALARSCDTGRPVRVTRGAGLRSPHAPESGLRYDGLFRVDDYWQERGAHGYLVWRFRLLKLEAAPAASTQAPSSDDNGLALGNPTPARAPTVVQRVIRNSDLAEHVKRLHEYCCQVCGWRLETPAGAYAEAAHIRPLGRPHNGPDTSDNILCLCPNHHVMFDRGALVITDALELMGVPGALRTHERHQLADEHIRYHRRIHGRE